LGGKIELIRDQTGSEYMAEGGKQRGGGGGAPETKNATPKILRSEKRRQNV